MQDKHMLLLPAHTKHLSFQQQSNQKTVNAQPVHSQND